MADEHAHADFAFDVIGLAGVGIDRQLIICFGMHDIALCHAPRRDRSSAVERRRGVSNRRYA